MEQGLLISVTAVIVLGVGAQWVAWRLKMPSILLLLLAGFAAGPLYAHFAGGAPLIDPDEMMGDLLFPIVSASVALILFEGGLSLRFSEVMKVGGIVISIVTVGAAITWVTASAAAVYILGLSLEIAILLGAVLVVTGPTVIGPMLRDIRPKGNVGPILKWEGIVIDPIGAILAVLVFETIANGHFNDTVAPGLIAAGMVKTFLIGGTTGILGAGLLYFLMRKYLIPDFLLNPITLMSVVGVFTVSNVLSHESGLVATTIMGVTLANQNKVNVRDIIDFKEDLTIIILAFLFVLLASRVQIEQLTGVGPAVLLFIVVLMLVARPLSVFVSTVFTGLSLKEKLFLSWVAPRGIVAAAVSAIFGLRLAELGTPGAGQLGTITFLVIVGTVTVYGLTAGPLARRLGLAQDNPQGVLIIGASPFSTELAKAVRDAGFKVTIVDSNWRGTEDARMAGIEVFYGSIITHCAVEEINLTGIGKMLALTSNDEVNSLAALHLSEIFGRSHVFQLPQDENTHRCKESVSPLHLRGRFLFGDGMSHYHLNDLVLQGYTIKTTRITEEFSYEDMEDLYSNDIIPLMRISPSNKLYVYALDDHAAPKPGHKILALVNTEKEKLQVKKNNDSH